MSGIAAILHTSDEPIDESLIRLMAGSMAMRGPDDQAYQFSPNFALAQAKLGHQAGTDSHCYFGDNDLWISTSARIDGRSELAGKLNQSSPNSHLSNEQVIMEAYRQWGVNCLDHLIGDFAFVLWDPRNKRLFCATDHFGVVPLFYAKTRHGLCLSNSINTIRLHPDVTNELNQAAISDYLVSRVNHDAGGTIFKNIDRLPAAHKLIVQGDQLHIQRYWRSDTEHSLQFSKPEQYKAQFKHLLRTSIKDRLSGNNRIGSDLSGGMDSTTITILTQELLIETGQPFDLHAYTLGSNGLLDDLEGPLARQIAQISGIKHRLYKPDQNRLIPEITPLHLISPEPAFMRRSDHQINKLTHIQSYRGTLLTGFGGDPLLYPRTIGLQDIQSPYDIFSLFLQSVYHYQAFGKLHALRMNRHSYQAARMVPQWLRKEFVKQSNLADRLQLNQATQLGINAKQHGMSNDALWQRLFTWNDPGFSHIPVNVCHPFFDKRLLDFALQLPPFPWRHNKHLLRATMANLLPSSVLNRPKTPVQGNRIQALLNAGSWSKQSDQLLANPALQRYVNGEKLADLSLSESQLQANIGKGLMATLTFSYWLNHYQQIPSAIAQQARAVPVRQVVLGTATNSQRKPNV